MSTQKQYLKSPSPKENSVQGFEKYVFGPIGHSSTCFTFSMSPFKQMEDGREGGDGSIRV